MDRCPACSGELVDLDNNDPTSASFLTCRDCGGITTRGVVPEAVARSVVANAWCRCEADPHATGEAVYFDFETRGGRSHGWFHPSCRGLTQVG